MKTNHSNYVPEAKVQNKSNNAKMEVTLFNQEKVEFLNRVNFDADMVSLTDLWKEAGSPSTKRPIAWKNQEATQQLIETLSVMLQSNSGLLWKTKRGGTSPGTYAHKSIALAYAKYLDAKLHVLVNEVFFQRVEEEKDPDLIVDRAIKTYQKKGRSDEWITKRLNGKGKRNEFTACLASHGVEKDGFRNCTNAIYTPFYGGTTAVVREKKNLAKNESIRDNLSAFELDCINFAESLSKQTIEQGNIQGNGSCELACSRSAKIVANAVLQSKGF